MDKEFVLYWYEYILHVFCNIFRSEWSAKKIKYNKTTTTNWMNKKFQFKNTYKSYSKIIHFPSTL